MSPLKFDEISTFKIISTYLDLSILVLWFLHSMVELPESCTLGVY